MEIPKVFPDKEYLSFHEAGEILKKIAFEDVRYVWLADNFNRQDILGHLGIQKPVVLRDYHRTRPEQPPMELARLRDVDEKHRADEIFGYVTKSEYNPVSPAQRTDILHGNYIIPHMDINRFLFKVISCTAALLTHEIQEAFYYAGERIFDPHVMTEFLAPKWENI